MLALCLRPVRELEYEVAFASRYMAMPESRHGNACRECFAEQIGENVGGVQIILYGGYDSVPIWSHCLERLDGGTR